MGLSPTYCAIHGPAISPTCVSSARGPCRVPATRPSGPTSRSNSPGYPRRGVLPHAGDYPTLTHRADPLTGLLRRAPKGQPTRTPPVVPHPESIAAQTAYPGRLRPEPFPGIGVLSSPSEARQRTGHNTCSTGPVRQCVCACALELPESTHAHATFSSL